MCIHSRDSASIDFAEAAGSTANKTLWMNDIDSSYLFRALIRKQVLKASCSLRFEKCVALWLVLTARFGAGQNQPTHHL